MNAADVVTEAELRITRDSFLRCPYPAGFVTEEDRRSYDAEAAHILGVRPPAGTVATDPAFTAVIRRLGLLVGQSHALSPANRNIVSDAYDGVCLALCRGDLDGAAWLAVEAERAVLPS